MSLLAEVLNVKTLWSALSELEGKVVIVAVGDTARVMGTLAAAKEDHLVLTNDNQRPFIVPMSAVRYVEPQ